MSFELFVFNPSKERWRTGHVTVPWREIAEKAEESGIEPEQMILRDEAGTELAFQVDEIDSDDPSLKTLAVTLDRWVSPGGRDYSSSTATITVEKGQPSIPWVVEPQVEIHGDEGEERGVKFINRRLSVWFNLIPELLEDRRAESPIYAGAATSVQLDKKEILDFNVDLFWAHGIEKRCMQLNHIQLPCPPWDFKLHQQVDLFNRSYELVDYFVGPVRASIIIAAPFNYSYWTPTTQQTYQLKCKLYRVISLYAGAPYLMEEVFVKGFPEPKEGGVQFARFFFKAHYFTYLYYPELQVSRFEMIPDWFAVSNLSRPFHGYGFITDVHADSVFSDSEKENCSVSWRLFLTKQAKCLHYFTRFEPEDKDLLPGQNLPATEEPKKKLATYEIESHVGQAWNDLVYKPLKISTKENSLYGN